MVVLAAIRILFHPAQRIDLDDQTFALVVIVPISSTFIYFLTMFTFGLSGDVAARQSIYPPRMFTLPVTTSALAGLPMLYGGMAMALLWFATRILALWPTEVDVPVIWPALLAASLLAWTQALTWMPYPLPGLRVIVMVLWLATIDAVVMLALPYKAAEPVMLAILAPHVPLAYLTARHAVARARRGDVPDWRGVFARLRVTADVPHFLTPAGAQTWFEWRRHGRSLPAMMAILLPFQLALLFLFRETPVLIFETLLGVLLTPPFMAMFVAATVSYGVTPFITTRPLTSTSLIAAKLQATMRSTLAAWLLVIIAIPLAVKLSGTAPVVMEWADDLVNAVGIPRAIVLALLLLAALVASTWKQLVQGLYIGMSGREWLVKGCVFVALSLLAVIVPLGHWVIGSKVAIATLWTAFPAILAVLVAVKLFAAAWIAIRLHDSGLLRDHTLVIGAACWTAGVFALYGLLVWLLPSILFSDYFLVLIAILAVPMARLSAAPLALAWNRHR